jgi:hypothetical protein
MIMQTAVFTPQDGGIFLPIPQVYMGKEVRVTFSVSPIAAEQKTKIRLSDRFRGVFSKEDAESFNKHTEISRKEWNNNI